jgi:hypothetical protein
MESVFGIQDSGITEQICMLQIQVGPDLNISSLLRSNSVLCFVCLFVCLCRFKLLPKLERVVDSSNSRASCTLPKKIRGSEHQSYLWLDNKGCVTLWPLPFTIKKKYLKKAKEELWKLKYFTNAKL